jgi:hypothetical protein
MNIKIFRANRGEGKTKWLFEMAATEYGKGKTLYYVGEQKSMRALVDLWEANFHGMCPIVNVDTVRKFEDSCCFLTDEMMSNLSAVDMWKRVIAGRDDPWYIAAEKEYFVN